jgi:hypothetical protein
MLYFSGLYYVGPLLEVIHPVFFLKNTGELRIIILRSKVIHPVCAWLPVMVKFGTNLKVLVAQPTADVICFLMLCLCPLEVATSYSLCIFFSNVLMLTWWFQFRC